MRLGRGFSFGVLSIGPMPLFIPVFGVVWWHPVAGSAMNLRESK
jgi:hypothetical protein